ncbi:G-type lectin S-receptor-like serine/threonine-protein kinase At4g27290 isoform X2 [Lactuca sativa]|uniref:G-type lectin S-receptor-like serine/threonine-protein kinase At4g27290 isoform X2 n=2 Tax=Lactuca sativa TaxID=4236 RepID=UPI001C68BF36|nr:G-type lectin S-receptor-like serine/threonine-protein kinase At4g27290 isoform X2 [Lactuca sativa]
MDDHIHPILPFFFIPFFFLLSNSAALNTISVNEAIKDGNTIVSDGEMFELGFFSPRNSKNRYLGIWYKKISTGTVVWVANRETPITDNSGEFKLRSSGGPVIHSGGTTVIWSSNYTVSSTNLDPVAHLLDTGNLIVCVNRKLIWQSFDYPGDTLLPGMKIGKDLVTGLERCLTSWKGPEDPTPGHYVYSLDTNGYPQMLQKHGSSLNFRIGPWNGVRFHGLPIEDPNQFYSSEFVISETEIYYKFKLKSPVFERIVLMSDGNTVQLHWTDRIQDWVHFGDAVVDACGRYGVCGPYGVCRMKEYPPCRCMEGFGPTVQEDWKAADWSRGCRLKKPLDCESGKSDDGFKKVAGLKFPDTRGSWYNKSMTLEECEMTCKRDCNCTAYANLDVRNGGSGCLLWFGDLMDIREYDEDHDIYIKMAASELAGFLNSSTNKKKGALIIILSISSGMLLLSAVVYVCAIKTKRPHMKKRGNWEYDSEKNSTGFSTEDLDELPFFSLNSIAKATNGFSINNKIGEGGFGPVYKGVLEDGQEVAVKRLSKTSHQGVDEFKNEVFYIAKLQHRNLVKLLGYCIHGNEMILIYEYMVNGSLDSFLFDETKHSMLDWPHRFGIIHGMARGNILLDEDMNPKISDFGLARKFVGFDTSAKTKKVVGTYGYISPEYAVHGRFSTKSDVFSFGVLVLEIVSGRKNQGFSHKDHSDNLLGHTWRLFKENKSIELMNASLRDSCVMPEVLRSIHVGLLCVQHNVEDRPTMLSVVLMLISEGVLPQPKQPAFFTGESYPEHYVKSSDEYMITLPYAR